MKNPDQNTQEKTPRSLWLVIATALLFLILSAIYIYYNHKHHIATAKGELGVGFAPFIAACISFFNAYVASVILAVLAVTCTRINTKQTSYAGVAVTSTLLLSLILIIDFAVRINPDLQTIHKDKMRTSEIIGHLKHDDLQGFLQSDWRCKDHRSVRRAYTAIKNINNTDKIINRLNQHADSNNDVYQCLANLFTSEWTTKAIDSDAKNIYYWQLHQLYALQDLKQRKQDYFRSWRCSEKAINTNTISPYEITKCNTVLEHALAKNDSYYLDLLLELASASDQASYLQFALLTNNEILFDRLTDKNDSIPLNSTSLAIVARYSDDNLYNKVIRYPWKQDDINQALLIAVKIHKSTESPLFDQGIKRLLIMGAKEIQSDDNHNKLLANVPTDISVKNLQLLIDRGVDTNAQDQNGTTLLTRKTKIGDTEIASIKILLENGADIHLANNIGETPFSVIPPYNRDHSLIELMLKYGANINDTDHDGATLLMRTVKFKCTKDNSDKIKFMIDHGARLDMRTKHQESIFEYGKYRCMEPLVALGADINTRDNKGKTPLINCIDKRPCSSNTIKALIDNGANLNLKDNEGKQAVHYATSEEVLNSLIINGADIKALDGLLEITEQKLQELKNEKKSQYSERKIKQVTEFKKHILRQISEKSHR